MFGISSSSWYRRSKATTAIRGRPRDPLDPAPAQAAMIQALAERHPYWGHKRRAVPVLREFGSGFSDRLTYRVMSTLGLIQQRIPYQAELHQTQQLFELLPTAPNGLWQMDVTYVHLPQGQWWYIVSVIDYYSRYLLTCSLTPFQNATVESQTLSVALLEGERSQGPLPRAPILVTDNGACFLARIFQSFLRPRFRHVSIQYRTTQQLGLLERFHGIKKRKKCTITAMRVRTMLDPVLRNFVKAITRCVRIGS